MTRFNGYFLLSVDDGGFYRTMPDNKGKVIDPSAYSNLAKIASRFEIQIIIACTTSFLDIKRVSQNPRPHENTEQILNVLERYPERFVIADHGYTHRMENSYREFYDPTTARRRKYEEQAALAEQSAIVYHSLGWPTPELFIPPAHGWEPGVTDQIFSQCGYKYLSSVIWIKKQLISIRQSPTSLIRNLTVPEHVYPASSEYLTILPRLGLGIPSHLTRIPSFMWHRAYASVMPTSRMNQLLWHRHPVTLPHNYMAHISNFCFDSNYRSWCRFLEKIASSKIPLAPSFTASIDQWTNHEL